MKKEEFLKLIKPDFLIKFDYSIVPDDFRLKSKIEIICPNHGSFKQTGQVHANSHHGCPSCSIENRQGYSWQEFIEIAKKKYKNKYKYTEPTNFVYSKTPINITCECGNKILLRAKEHIHGKKGGCKSCQYTKNAQARIIDVDVLQKQLDKFFPGFNYRIDKNKYICSSKQVKVNCPNHGNYSTKGYNFQYGHGGCPKCAKPSNLEKIIEDVLVAENIPFDKNTRKVIKPKEIDFWIPSLNLGIEAHGLYWHSSGTVYEKYHLDKLLAAESKNIQLLQFFEDEILTKKPIIESIIRNKLGLSKIFHARKFSIREVPVVDKTSFLDANHLQGSCGSNYNIGLYDKVNNELFAIMTFGKPRISLGSAKYDYELVRYCSKINTSIIGGAARLFNFFTSKNPGKSVITYSDRRYATGKLYENLGFEFLRSSQPGYTYYKSGHGQLRLGRFQFRKSLLSKKLPIFDPSLSEYENMKNNNYLRIYDCGNKVWAYSKNK